MISLSIADNLVLEKIFLFSLFRNYLLFNGDLTFHLNKKLKTLSQWMLYDIQAWLMGQVIVVKKIRM